LCWEAKEKRPLPRSDTSSVHDRGRVKQVCKTSSETGLDKQIVRMLRAELRCNDIEPTPRKNVCVCVNITEIYIANERDVKNVKCSECCQKLKMEATSMFCLFYENASGIMNVTT
jgi:hypothetical protein